MAWSPDVNVTNQGSGKRAVFPEVVHDSNNHLHLVWTGGNDPTENWQVWYQSFNGSTWSTPLALSVAGGTRADIAIDNSDNLHVVYEHPGEDNIWYRKRTAGVWGSPVNLRSGGRSISPSISVKPDGSSIIVAWHEDGQVGGEWDIFVNLFNNNAWSGVDNISEDSALSAPCKTASDTDGNFHVLWQSGGDEMWYRRRASNGVWSGKIRIDHTAERSAIGDIAVSPDGLVHALYSEDDGAGGWEVWHRFFNGSVWSQQVNVSLHGGETDDVNAALYADPFNRIHAVWHDFNNIWYSTSTSAGSSWSPRQPVVSNKHLASEPAITVDNAGVNQVFWQSRPTLASNWNIYRSTQANPPVGPRGTLAGVVRDTFGDPVPFAVVTAAQQAGVTSVNGAYSFLVEQGTHTAAASKQFFITQEIPNVHITENATTQQDFAITPEAPATVSTFTADPGNTSVKLEWTNPTSGQFGGTMIRVATDTHPLQPDAGQLVADVPGDPGSSGQFTHPNLTNGVTYFYAVFAHDGRPNRTYALPRLASATPALQTDTDRDGDVDQVDYGKFQACLTGSTIPQNDPACVWARLDEDDDVDQNDFGLFLNCYSGPHVPAAPNCLD